jgi:NAD(P)-dependent dehydrogenase (short-subunit alcohol dehydrogenase family)
MATWLITGANRGIGLELCRQAKARGGHVIGACRAASSELEALAAEIVDGVDVAKASGAEAIRRATEGRRVDVLIHNAGILRPDSLETLDLDTIRSQFEVNALGPLHLTQVLLPRLGQGSKIALVSSLAGSIADNTSGGMYGYRMSKAALNMAGVSLARDLAGRGVHVLVIHPGAVRTQGSGHRGNDDPPVAAKRILARLDELTGDHSGKFLHANGKELPW